MNPLDNNLLEREPGAAEETMRHRYLDRVSPGTLNIYKVREIRRHAKDLSEQPIQMPAMQIDRQKVAKIPTHKVIQMPEKTITTEPVGNDLESSIETDNVLDQISDHETNARMRLAEAQEKGVVYHNPEDF